MNKKVCFAASSGGHYEQLMMLKPLMNKYNSIIVTEKTEYITEVNGLKTYYMIQVNRKEKNCFLNMFKNTFRSLVIFLREQPDVIICTGVLAMVPLCLICKIFGKINLYRIFCKGYKPDRNRKISLQIRGSILCSVVANERDIS